MLWRVFDVKAAVLFIEGTNCEDETVKALSRVGYDTELVHLKQLAGTAPSGLNRSLEDYQLLFIPGGWSSGDYIRAGAIFAARMKSTIGKQFERFIDEGNTVVGVCNGFQVMVEYGVLPAVDGVSQSPQAVLALNNPPRFQCRPVYLRHVGRCPLTEGVGEDTVMQLPVAHAEGRFTTGGNQRLLDALFDNKQVLFQYCRSNGDDAGGYPWNPNGADADIAGICNPAGNVVGLMPHPERAIDVVQMADWTRSDYERGDGLLFFESIARAQK